MGSTETVLRSVVPWAIAAAVGAGLSSVAVAAGTTWDGGGGATTSWGTATNWDTDTLPNFNGADSLSVTTGFGANTALTLGADRSIGRITFGGGATVISLTGNTLQLNSTTSSAGLGTALWNANTADGKTATVNSNLLLQTGTGGSYTGYFRENVNSNGGTRFNGTITQGAGESWTLRFSRASSRGTFLLNNASNSISAIRNDGADVYSEVVGSFGGAALTLAGGATGTTTTDHYTTAVSNSITLAANAQWASQIQTRLTGAVSQGAFQLTYGLASNSALGNGALTRIEFSSYSGTGTTTLVGGALSTSSMSNLSSGLLNLGSSSSAAGTFVLSGSTGNSVPTWSDFAAAKTYNQAGGSGNWRIDAGTVNSNTGPFGGFAARGADLVIPASGGGLTDQTFARNFVLGSAATLDGVQYAANSVTIQTDIAYGSVAGANRYFQIAPNAGTSKTTNTLTLAGPVHELAGQITGDSVVLYPVGQINNSSFGIVRISNATNSLTGTSRWMIGGTRGAYTSAGVGAIAAGGNMADLSSSVLIFTSDGAFGGATEVQVTAQASSGARTTGTMLFEDTNNAGNTTFTRSFNLVNNDQAASGPPAWGSYAGDVVYTGTATMSGILAGANDSIIHVQSGTMALGVNGGSAATITNNMSGATTFDKSGAGTLYINNLTLNGTQSTNNWAVRGGALIVNSPLSGSGSVSVSNGATLGGSSSIAGTVTTSGTTAKISPGDTLPGTLTIAALTASSGADFKFELGPTSGGASSDLLAVTGGFTGSSSANGLVFELNGAGIGINGPQTGVTYTLITYGSSSGLDYTDFSAVLQSGLVLDTSSVVAGTALTLTPSAKASKCSFRQSQSLSRPHWDWLGSARSVS